MLSICFSVDYEILIYICNFYALAKNFFVKIASDALFRIT